MIQETKVQTLPAMTAVPPPQSWRARVDSVISCSHQENFLQVGTASPAQERGKIGPRTQAHDEIEADGRQNDLHRLLEEVSLELRAAQSDARHGEAFRHAQESVDNQRFRGRVALSAHSHLDDENTSMAAICTLNSRELVLLGGPELATTLLAVPLSHIVIDVQAGLDTVFCITGHLQKISPTARVAQSNSRVFLHVHTEMARDTWLAVLHELKAATRGWTPIKDSGDVSRCGAACSSSSRLRSFAYKIDNPVKIGFGNCNFSSCTARKSIAAPTLVDSLPGRRLSLNNALPLVIWLPD